MCPVADGRAPPPFKSKMKRSMKGGNVSIEANECRIFHTFVTYAHTHRERERERENIHFFKSLLIAFHLYELGLILISPSGTI